MGRFRAVQFVPSMQTCMFITARAMEVEMAKSKRKKHQLAEIARMELENGQVVITPVEKEEKISIKEAFRRGQRKPKLLIKSSHGG